MSYRQFKIFTKVGQGSRSRSQGQIFWYGWKGLDTRYTHVKFETPVANSLKVIGKV